MKREAQAPQCWRCRSTDVAVRYGGTATLECVQGCLEKHHHTRTVVQVNCRCRTCGNQWTDGSGDLVQQVLS